jgi:hypothetical protein
LNRIRRTKVFRHGVNFFLKYGSYFKVILS